MEESTKDSDKFYSSDNDERNNNDDKAIPSISTSTSNLKSVKKRKARRPENISITTDNGANVKSAIQQMGITNIKEVRRGAKTMSSYLLSEEEFELLKELIEILSPFDDATEFLSGSKYPMLGFITPILEELAHRLRYFTRQNDEAIFVKDTILNNLIKSQFNELNSTDDNTAPTNNNNTSHQHKKLKMVTYFSYSQTENVTPNEFDHYCELPEVSLDKDPVLWLGGTNTDLFSLLWQF
ncbi:hypothetical protein F8M41_016469 [Gigaspora margarita]|uniref:Uncharacterized protein n=1 Tax=Gigaspora margarita TaxID=4874 RepID=A0A8H4AP93_GIGMA|nr:hypothetical protein F8M41_016469 [Gigaspora margarita]